MNVKRAIQDVVVWRGLNFLSAFVVNVLVARLLGAADAGSLFFFINNLSLLILLLSFSLESGLGYYAAGNRATGAKLGAIALLWSLAATLLVLLLFNRIAGLLAPTGGVHSKIFSIGFVLGSLLNTFFASLYYARKNFFVPNIIGLLINLALVILFSIAAIKPLDNTWLIYAYFGGFLLQGTLVSLFYFFNPEENERMAGASGLGDLVKYSATVFLGNLVFFLVYRVDYWFVEKYCSGPELGNYIQVSKIVQWLLLVPMMISAAIFPLVAMQKPGDMRDRVVKLSRLLFWLYLAGTAIVAATGYWGFVWIFGETYSAMYLVFLLHIPGILALAALYPLSSYYAGINRASVNLHGSLLALFVIVGCNVLFTPAYGIYAASMASSAGYIVYFLFSFYRFNKEHRLTILEIFKPMAGDYHLLKSALYRRK